MLTPTLLAAFFALYGPVMAMPIRDSVTRPPVGFVVVPAAPVPAGWVEIRPWLELQDEDCT